MASNQQLMADLVASVSYAGKRPDWRTLPDDDVEKVALRKDTPIESIIDQLDTQDLAIGFADGVQPVLRDAFMEGALDGHEAIDFPSTKDSLTFLNKQALKNAQERAAELVGMRWDEEGGEFLPNPNAAWAITETTRENLRKLVEQSVNEGWGATELRQHILDSESFSESRAQMIARTELASAYVNGEMDAWRDSGVVTGKEAVMADSHPQVDECDEAAEAGVIGLDEAFPSGDMNPPFHPNCLCDVLPVTAEKMAKAHDVSDEARDEKGQWTLGGDAPITQKDTSTAAHAALRSFENANSKEEIEHAQCALPDGAKLFDDEQLWGSANHVSFAPDEIQAMTGRNVVFTHNHPKDYSLSPADVRMAIHINASEMRAVHGDHAYVMARGPNGWPKEDDFNAASKSVYSELVDSTKAYSTEETRAYTRDSMRKLALVFEGRMTYSEVKR
jgi:hypothetical protein